MSAVTNQSIDNRIDTVTYYRLPGTTVTICQIKMVNGFVVLGESACVNPADFNQEKGEQIAHDNDYFACHAMTGLLAMQASPNLGGACRNGAYYDHGRADLMAKDAYAIADEMMKARAE